MSETSNLKDYRRLVMMAGRASVITAVFFILIKFMVWIISSSSSIFASMTDSMVDAVASLINFLAIRFSVNPPDRDHRFGHFKAQSLASLAQATFIGASGLMLIAHGAGRIKHPEPVQYIDLAVGVSVAGIVFTMLLVAFQGYVYRKTRSEAVGADRLHYMSDILLNLAVIAALLLNMYGFLWADGLFAVLIGLYIIGGSMHIGKNAVNVLLDSSLSSADNQIIMQRILATAGVDSIHDLKTRQAGPQIFIQCHVVMDGDLTLNRAHEIANLVEKNLLEIAPDADITIHMEPNDKATLDGIVFDDA